MDKKQKKMAVLLVLQQRKKPLQLPDVLKILGKSYSERSVRRWLNALVSENLVEKTGQKRGTHYCAGESPNSEKALDYIHKPLFQRKPVTYNQGWVKSYHPNKTFYLSPQQKKALRAIGKPEMIGAPAGTYARKIYDRLLIELSYNSSRLEGNTYSLGETEKLVLAGESNTGKLNAEKIMILNHKEAIRYLVDSARKIDIDITTVCTLHYLLSEGLVLSKDAGKIRDHSIKIGASTYIPMDDQSRLIHALNQVCAIAKKILDPHEQSFFLLVHIAYLQAFSDVNKRTARLSCNIPLIKNNLYPIAFNKIEKEDYISAMISIYELQDVNMLAELYTFSCVATAEEYRVIADAMGINETRVRYRAEIRKIIREIILKKLTRSEMKKFIKKSVHRVIPDAFQTECIQVIEEDLTLMGLERIQGLGITKSDLERWKKKK